MQNNQLKELWAIRFQRVFNLEYESFFFYKKLIRNYQKLLEDSDAEKALRAIMKDEIKHARAARELIRIVSEKEIKQTDSTVKIGKFDQQSKSGRK